MAMIDDFSQSAIDNHLYRMWYDLDAAAIVCVVIDPTGHFVFKSIAAPHYNTITDAFREGTPEGYEAMVGYLRAAADYAEKCVTDGKTNFSNMTP